ncbi:hypothetical protein [Actinomadura sp. HBU206391]|nr:hypothetical protein [Actinomadura sp. HBU206391]
MLERAGEPLRVPVPTLGVAEDQRVTTGEQQRQAAALALVRAEQA